MSKPSYVGAPAIFALSQACQQLNDAFGGYGCYLVGSALERADWRDVDLRYIMSDEDFAVLFPNAGQHWENDPRWLLLTVAISERLSKVTGLPIDFQIQPQTHANERHAKPRNAIGLRIAKERPDKADAETSVRVVEEKEPASVTQNSPCPQCKGQITWVYDEDNGGTRVTRECATCKGTGVVNEGKQ